MQRSDLRHLTSSAAVAAFIRENYNNDDRAFVDDYSALINFHLKSSMKEVTRLVRFFGTILRWLPARHRPRYIAMKARTALYSHEFTEALRLYHQAEQGMLANRDYLGAARIRSALLATYNFVGQHDRALAIGRKAIRYFKRTRRWKSLAHVYTNVGNVYNRTDRNHLALSYYQKAEILYGPDEYGELADLRGNCGNIYANFNQLDKAEQEYRQAATMHRALGHEAAALIADYSIAYMLFLQNRLGESLAAFYSIYDASQRIGNRSLLATTQLDLAEVHISLNQLSSAITEGVLCIGLSRRLKLRYEQGKASYFVAEAYRRLGDYTLARTYLKRAQKLFEKEANHLWLGMVRLARIRLMLDSKRGNHAYESARSAQQLLKKSGDERRMLDGELVCIESLINDHAYDDALKLARRILRKNLCRQQHHAAYRLMARCYLAKGDVLKALASARKGISMVESALAGLSTDETRFFFALDKLDIYLIAIHCLLKLNRTEEGFVQHSRALSAINQRIIPAATLRREIPPDLLQKRDQLRSELKKMQFKPDNRQRGSGHEQSYFAVENRLLVNERKIRATLKDSRSNLHEDFQHQRVREMLNRGECLVSFVSLDTTIGAFVATASRIQFLPLPVSHSDLYCAVREFHYLCETEIHSPSGETTGDRIPDHYLERFRQWLLDPLPIPQEITSIILLIDNIFAQIPYAAVFSSSHTSLSGRQWRIIVNPADLVKRNRTARPAANRRSAIFAAEEDHLPFVGLEKDVISRYFPKARTYSRSRATVTALKKEFAAASGFIHIATHASRSSENPLFSRLLLHDGPFFPFDLYEIGIRAQLVTLSGCQTAAPGIYYGNSFSLGKAFYQGGARFVLASLWSVSDRISMAFMASFYSALADRNDVFDAYEFAIQKTKSIHGHPAYWSPFVLIGM